MSKRKARDSGPKISGKEQSQRQLRAGEVIRHALADLLARGEMHDPLLSDSSITVSEVRLSPDLKQGTAFVMPLGGVGIEGIADADMLVAALNKHKGTLSAAVARQIAMKFAPRLSFALDDTFDKGAAMDSLLRDPD